MKSLTYVFIALLAAINFAQAAENITISNNEQTSTTDDGKIVPVKQENQTDELLLFNSGT